MDEIETNKLIDQIFTSMEKELQNQKISVKHTFKDTLKVKISDAKTT